MINFILIVYTAITFLNPLFVVIKFQYNYIIIMYYINNIILIININFPVNVHYVNNIYFYIEHEIVFKSSLHSCILNYNEYSAYIILQGKQN